MSDSNDEMEMVVNSEVRLLESRNGCWESQQVSLNNLCNEQDMPRYRIVFLTSTASPSPMPSSLTKTLANTLHIPEWFWMVKNRRVSGFYYANTTRSIDGKPPQHTSSFRFLVKHFDKPWTNEPEPPGDYSWHRLSFVTHWTSPVQASLICLNIPSFLESSLEQSVLALPVDHFSSHPYAIHAHLLDHITTLNDAAVWQLRDTVRHYEVSRPTISHSKPRYSHLHNLARHITHSTEMYEAAVRTAENMLSDLHCLPSSILSHLPLNTISNPLPEILRQKSLLKSLHLRSQALESRLKNEIHLAFHIAAQRESVLAQQIAQAAKEDSRAVKTISVLGLVFLPGTFVSSLFSTSFFDFDSPSSGGGSTWSVSDQFWIYWAVTLPITAFTVAWWFYWQRKLMRRSDRVERGEDLEMATLTRKSD